MFFRGGVIGAAGSAGAPVETIQNHEWTIIPRTGYPRNSRFPDGNGFVPSDGFSAESGYSVSHGGHGFQDGSNITIVGTGFGEKTNPAPMYLWDSRSGNLSPSPFSRRSFTINQGSPKAIDPNFRLNNRATMRATLRPASGVRVNSGVQLFFPFTNLDGPGNALNLFTRCYRNWSGTDAYAKWQSLASSQAQWNIKDWRWWANYSTSSITTNMMLAYGQANSVAGHPRITYEYTDGSTYINVPGFVKNSWRTHYYRYKDSSNPGVADSFIKVFQNDIYAQRLNVLSRTTSRPAPKEQIASIQYQFLYTNENWYDWWDICYVDDSLHAVVLVDGVWGAASAKYEMAIPIQWVNTEIVANLRSGEFSTLTGKRLYVVKASGDPTLIGQFT